jgi:hypothetical protein
VTEHVLAYVIPAAYSLQESKFRFRRQVKGPARGFWQFEVAGVRAVLEHDRCQVPISRALIALRYDYTLEADVLQPILEHHDVLACCFARCLLWASPKALPTAASAAWKLYLSSWRPGKPHRDTWDANHATAWSLVSHEA